MIRTIASVFMAFSLTVAPQREVRIAILDTGIDIHDTDLVFCKGLSRDFTGTGLQDDHGHGTNVAYIIRHFSMNRPYCLIVVKVIGGEKKHNKIQYLINGLNYIADLKPDIVNASLTGQGSIPQEKEAVMRILKNGTRFVAAAGNNSLDLDEDCNTFPACYSDKIISVGNLAPNGERNPSSNYGHYIKRWEMGTGILAGGMRLSGTSQAAALATGKIVRDMK